MINRYIWHTIRYVIKFLVIGKKTNGCLWDSLVVLVLNTLLWWIYLISSNDLSIIQYTMIFHPFIWFKQNTIPYVNRISLTFNFVVPFIFAILPVITKDYSPTGGMLHYYIPICIRYILDCISTKKCLSFRMVLDFQCEHRR